MPGDFFRHFVAGPGGSFNRIVIQPGRLVRFSLRQDGGIFHFPGDHVQLFFHFAHPFAQDLFINRPATPGASFKIIAELWKEEENELLKKIMKNLLKNEKTLVCLVNIFPDKVQWSIGCSEDMKYPFDEVKAELLSLIDGKGGGRHPLWQGTGLKPGGAGDFLARFRSSVK
jgi:hypothetical protein